MLGNQYFMARNYAGAQHEFEEYLTRYPDNLFIIKKLIICYTQTGHIEKALNYFRALIEKNISLIVDTEPAKEDCPCPELVDNLESTKSINTSSFDYFVILGIIWLYCDANKSIEYFERARSINSGDQRVHSIIKLLNNYLNNKSLIS